MDKTGAYGGGSSGPEYWDDRFKLTDTAYVVMEVNITDDRTDVPTIHADVRGKKISTYDNSGIVATEEDVTKTLHGRSWITYVMQNTV